MWYCTPTDVLGRPYVFCSCTEWFSFPPPSVSVNASSDAHDLALLDRLASARRELATQIAKRIVGQTEVVDDLIAALLSGGHVVLIGVPGLAKTLLVQTVSQALDLSFSRVQFTPDLMPSDITGTELMEEESGTGKRAFRFAPGPVFANMILADEINRAPPKTQSALLEAMEERQVTADGVTHQLPKPFLVVGTQNPIEQEGTYPLPEAQLDRFLIRTDIGYPGVAAEVDMVLRRARRGTERLALNPILRPGELLRMQQRVEEVFISDPVAHYVVNIVEATRQSPRTEAGASPRGSLGLLKAARARAAIAGRSFVLPDDVKALAVPVLAHRIILHPDQWVRGVQADHVVAEVLQQVPAPVGADDASGQRPVQQVATPQFAPPQQQSVAPQHGASPEYGTPPRYQGQQQAPPAHGGSMPPPAGR